MSLFDRKNEVEKFDETKLGVKGLVDSNITKIPAIFLHDNLSFEQASSELSVPVIDFTGITSESSSSSRRSEIIKKIKEASETWGFFQVINHGIPVEIIDEMIQGVRRFHEQDSEVKKQYYTRDTSKKFMYHSNFDLLTAPAANWRDAISCPMAPNPPQPHQLPPVCRDIMFEYSKYIMKLGLTVFELLSEALGLPPNHLKDMNCAEGLFLLGNYYPACPEPHKTLGSTSHTDSDFITLLTQDEMGGLQVSHQNQWVNVPPIYGAIVVNIGDLFQLITNDKFKSNFHRVPAVSKGSRISVASFFRTNRLYGPIEELLSEDNPRLYKEITLNDYLALYYGKGLDGTSPLHNFKLSHA